ncbi:tRNA(adenine(34)) deaminase, chloroplastic-like isoform X1 [Musa acuminata AAA Group]|uniref:tRNA(adenine(34)) deaminase, chloroplastic-like isoform X1 n=1 Tax=Musa acuminata AAA Group TaxID=214697 RepID=UPI0031D63AB7
MYGGYAAATFAVRAKSSICHSRRLALLDDGGGDEFALHGLSINPRFMLYGYYSRQSSLIYWSHLRTFLAGHGRRHYLRLSLRDVQPCAPRVPARRGGCRACCCCRSPQPRFQMAGECCRESFDDGMWEDDADYVEFGDMRRHSRREVKIRSDDGEKVRSLRARKDTSSSVCPSCGHENKMSGGLSSGGNKCYTGKKVNAAVREVREGWKLEDDVDYDSREESDYRANNYNVRDLTSARVSNRKTEGRSAKSIASAYQEKEDHQFKVEDEVKKRDSRERSRKFAKIVKVDDNVDVASSFINMADLRKVDRDKQVVEQDKQEVDKRMQRGASCSFLAHGRRDEYYLGKQNIIGRESREGSQKSVIASDVHEDDMMMTSRPKRHVDERKVDMAESSLKQHGQVDKRVVRRAESRTEVSDEYVNNENQVAVQREAIEGSQRFRRIPGVHEDNAGRIASAESMLDTRKVDKEHSSTSIMKKHTAVDQQAVRSYESREQLQNFRQIEEVHNSNIQNVSNNEKRHEEVLVKNRDDKSISVHMARDNRGHIGQQIIDKMELGKQYENQVDVSRPHVRGTENASSSQSLLRSRINDRVDYSTSIMNPIHQVEKHQTQSESQYTYQYSPKRESGKAMCTSELPRKDSGKVSTAQVMYNADIQNELNSCQYSSRRECETDARMSYAVTDIQRNFNSQNISNMRIRNSKERSSLLMVQDDKKKLGTVTGESSQPINQEITSLGAFDGDSSFLDTHMQQPDDPSCRDENYLVKSDTLDSASRLESSSAMYVGEFVDKLRHESSTFISSGTQTEKAHGKGIQATTSMQSDRLVATITEKDEKYIQEGSGRSSRSGIRGPSDEMWDVRSLISQKDGRKEEQGEHGLSAGVIDSTTTTPTVENTIAGRSPKSLWAHIADIMRMGWVHRAESHTSNRKSGKRSSSEGSEAWFSGQDASDDENDPNARSSEIKELLPVAAPVDRGHETHSSITQGCFQAPDVVVMQLGGGASTSMATAGGYASKGASANSRPEQSTLAENEKGTKSIIYRAITVDKPSLMTGDASSVAIDEGITYTGNLTVPVSGYKPSLMTGDASSVAIDEGITYTGNLTVPVSGYTNFEEDLLREEPPEADKTEGKDGELKRRKLRRNKQVLKETFEEWEEAYRFESERRKIDEYFMREALVEAQKAADIWEVPVGAVLVQNGKIIARGFNLVEERRDSTAHAEMICIREASNLLRTWRLAETTLYVTLEPCPMCAGAILQARVDTVVWGAPNKLLGADGSWIRLFPGDNGGSSSLDPSSQMAGPVHPFHPNIRIRRWVLATECSDVLQQFFQLRRKKKKKPESPPQPCLPVPNHPIKLFTRMHNIFSVMFCL